MEKYRSLVVVVICLALFGGRGVLVHAQSNYKEIAVANGGTIRGDVRLAGEIPRTLQLAVTKDENHCGASKLSPRLRVGKSRGVQNAIVWLEGISEGKRKTSGNKQFSLIQFKCEYSPHILLLPYGSSMDIVNSDPILHNVHTYDESETGRTLFNIAQPIKGQRTTVKQTQFKKPGLYSASCDAGHPWMNAYIMVTEHPYYTLTDGNGNFILENVPPGTYKLKMWHEGVAVVKTEMENGKPKAYRYEPPYEEVKEVTVSPNGKVDVAFSLALRPATPGVTANVN
jgi:plastocyanin